jgi:hypothetical protein
VAVGTAGATVGVAAGVADTPGAADIADTAGTPGGVWATALSAAAQASAATKSALAVKRGEGFSTNGVAPYGYRVGPDGKIVEDAREQEVIEKIRERTRGRLFEASSADVAEWLTRGGYLNRVGRPWHRSGILRILKTMRTREAVSTAEATS